MADIMQTAGDFILETTKEKADRFNGFEPWDIEEREDELIEFAADHNVKLTKEARPFQTGYFNSKKFLSINQGGNQIGKSIPAWIKAVMYCSGKIPLAMRLPKGKESKVKRNIDDGELRKENIRRWGRRDTHTGELIDHDEDAKPDGTWDCGYITGVGVFNTDLLPPRPAKVWICTFKQARDEYWWSLFKNATPDYVLDKKKGVNGFSESSSKVFFNTGSDVTFITYEQGYERVEAKTVSLIILDEEPPQRNFYLGCLQHAHQMSMHFTPINGISWSYEDLIIPAKAGENDVDLFHATQYDSPYKTKEMISNYLGLLKPWEVEARVLGSYSEQRGRPYYDREKINGWMRNYFNRGTKVGIEPCETWDNVDDLMGIAMDKVENPYPDVGIVMYEDVDKDAEYYFTADTAEGSEDPNVGQKADWNAGIMRRRAKDGEDYDPIVLTVHNQIPVHSYAKYSLYICRYYNNALLAPESTGESAGHYMAEIHGYPYCYKMVKMDADLARPSIKIGFITRHQSRKEAFNYVGEFIDSHKIDPKLPSLQLMKEMAQCVKGKNGRPDHARTEHNDMLVAFAVSEFVRRNAPEQIQNNADDFKDEDDNVKHKRYEVKESRPILGSRRGLDERQRDKVKTMSQASHRNIGRSLP